MRSGNNTFIRGENKTCFGIFFLHEKKKTLKLMGGQHSGKKSLQAAQIALKKKRGINILSHFFWKMPGGRKNSFFHDV
jgi:radical SAM superfamily enzyme